MDDKLKKRDDESKLEYFKRITDNRKEYDLDYSEWSSLILGEQRYGSENSRKMFYMVEKLLSQLNEDNIKAMPKNKIEEITELIGELDVKKQLVRNDTNKLNKLKRDFIKNVEIASYINEYIDREIENFKPLNYKKIDDNSEKTLMDCCSDWHIGYVIKDYKGNSYNYEIAKKRLSKFLSEIEKEIHKNSIRKVIVIQAGDITEGIYMRKNQSYECEFNSNEQIVMAEELFYGFITSISEMKVNVDVYSISGNHQRGNGDRDANIESDSNNFVIVNNLRKWFELANNERVTMCDIDFKENTAEFDLGFGAIKIKHGDTSAKEDKKFYDTECSMNNNQYSLLIRGHYHNFGVTSQNNGGKVITLGCLFGYNGYSVDKLQCTTQASQELIITDYNGVDYIKSINLQIV